MNNRRAQIEGIVVVPEQSERLVCSNGMTAFVADHGFEQTHSDPFQPQLAYHAVDSMVEGADTVEQRLEDAQERELVRRDEALLVLYDLGIDEYLENPVPDLVTALHEEVADNDAPTLSYNAATYALTHMTNEETPESVLDDAYERAAGLLEYGDGIPHPEILGENAVTNRANQLIEDPDEEEYWEGERNTLRDLMQVHEIEG